VRAVAVAGVAAAAIGAGLGTYFALGGPSHQRPPARDRLGILEKAIDRGVIDGYRLVRRPRFVGPVVYEVSGGRLQLLDYGTGCGGNAAGGGRPDCLVLAPVITIEYRHQAASQADALEHIVRARLPDAKIQSFEVTTPGG
jgi:hypothetical protein